MPATQSQPEQFDVLCVGFGPAGLAIAAAMADEKVISLDTTTADESLRVRFIEKQPSFLWHGGMLLDGTKMQISFLKDLATLRDPTSNFTFLKYLHENDRLVPFVNLGTWNPYRVEFNDYLSWAAKKFEKFCDYGEQVMSVDPLIHPQDGTVSQLRVTSRTSDGARIVRDTKNIIVAIGGQPRYPDFVHRSIGSQVDQTTTPHLAHTSQYTYRVQQMLPDAEASYRLAVIGSGQSAAEVFMDLGRRYPNAEVNLIFRDSALRPSDDSPFVNEVFDPDRRDAFYAQTSEQRKSSLIRDKATNYSVVNENLINEIYGMMYMQRLPGSETRPKHALMPNHSILDMHKSSGGITLTLRDSRSDNTTGYERTFDAVFLGTGYERFAHLDVLQPVLPYLNKDQDNKIVVGRDYRVSTTNACRAGIYVQGCCEDTHGLSDTLLSVLGVRGGEVLQSIQARMNKVQILGQKQSGNMVDVKQTATPPASPVPSPTTCQRINVDRIDSGINVTGTKKESGLAPCPPKPLPGTILFSKYIPHLNETFSLRVANLQTDIPLLTKWHNNPRVSKFWNEVGDESHHTKYLSTLLADPHSIPCIGMFNDVPFAYFEIYWAAHDRLAGYYDAGTHDRGFHLLVGEEAYRGSHRVEGWLPAVVEFMFGDCSGTKRVVLEPRADNGKLIGYLCNFGFQFKGEIKLPHKTAALMVMETE
ncbi:uncharacterized protein SPPG_04897 [Spizellomyces punctatus DAOM BR117]|uniref:L-ornithine N(5)-monooxygenase [NAD(P)H] n=1 Tax=Spizellomyces punctatus (strain DAOM BR117) TaxID=645134 RepID=A0A0L0HET9_SPIPD|nr:uncharacterized protein SPPG_04897 [Spizellomyces punctatus DAOM BR117]KNC99504.1 hypothetical protein SPPG_04897 [Spizellomyces punctatus DAOM BR117]|eukprot:XP_016607544.1 hypothetical protein SPPG_04897 [Spizellomyces punctatus DAOM BR117]